MTDAQDKELTVSAIGDTFRQIVSHMKGGFPVWEDFIARGMKFQKQLEQSIAAFNSFLEGLSKVAELAAHAKGGTRELGTGMTNVVMWHKGQELRLREMNQALTTKLLGPLQVKVEEWKKTTSQLDKDHEKEVQKSVKEIKESTKSTVKVSKNLESKLKKDKPMEKCKPLQHQLEQFQQETDRRIKETEEKERRNLSRVLLEERSWFCGFITALGKVLDIEIGMVGDLERLKVILKSLSTTISQPSILPETTREFVEKWAIPASPAIGRKRTATESTPAPAPAPSSVPPPPPSAPAPPPPPSTNGQNRPNLPPPPSGPIGPTPPPPQSHYPPPPMAHFPRESSPDHYEHVTMSASFPRESSMEHYEPSANFPQEFSSNHYELLTMSVSPSEASLMSTSSHQSTESSRSLSPPVGPTRSPVQSRTQLVSLQEEENAPSNFQLALMNKMRSRMKSAEDSSTEPSPPVNPRSSSLGSRQAPPPVATKPSRLPPPAVAQKPPRNHSPLEVSVSANGHHSPQLPQHHVLNQYSNEDDSSSSEDDSPLAKAIRQKKLRKTPQVNDRSNPVISSR